MTSPLAFKYRPGRAGLRRLEVDELRAHRNDNRIAGCSVSEQVSGQEWPEQL
jgi:hypothetical protein